jgi:hypothetical protein
MLMGGQFCCPTLSINGGAQRRPLHGVVRPLSRWHRLRLGEPIPFTDDAVIRAVPPGQIR